MDYFSTALLSIIQGLTELLPISSSGHLLLVGELLDLKSMLSLLTLLHLPSAMAILLFYRNELLATMKSLNISDLWKFFLAMIPAGITGIFAGDLIEQTFHDTRFVIFSLIFWGIIMIITERRIKNGNEGNSVDPIVKKISWQQAFSIGIMQILALIPGTSRSGITTLAGIWAGLEKNTALDFSFIIGLPILLGAFGYEFAKNGLPIKSSQAILLVILTFIVSYAALFLLSRMRKLNFLTIFGIYRIALGLGIIAVLFF